MKVILNILQLFASVALAAGLIACSSGNIAGNTSETGNPAIQISALRPSGSPAAGAEAIVRLRNARADTTVMTSVSKVQSIFLDRQGRGRLELGTQDSFALEIIDGDSLGALTYGQLLTSQSTLQKVNVTVKKPARVSGRVDSTIKRLAQSVYVYVDGTDYVTKADTTGAFVFDALPRSENVRFSVVAFDSDTLSLQTVDQKLDSEAIVVAEPTFNLSPLGNDTVVVRHILNSAGHAHLPLNDVIHIHPEFNRVDSLNLSGLDIYSLPGAVGRLDSCRYLNLSENRLETLPDELAGLSALRELNLSKNALQLFPTPVLSLNSLVFLFLTNNQLTEVPKELSALKSLERLSITSNSIASLPPEIFDLPALTVFSASNNKIRTLPSTVGQCTMLSILSVNENLLTALPEAICALSNVRELHVAQNQLPTVPDCIGSLTELRTLELQNNEITQLPVSLTQLSKVSHLDVADNRLCDPDESLAAFLDLNDEGWKNNQNCQ